MPADPLDSWSRAVIGEIARRFGASAVSLVSNGFLQIRGSPARTKPGRRAEDAAAGEKLWALSERLTGVRCLSG